MTSSLTEGWGAIPGRHSIELDFRGLGAWGSCPRQRRREMGTDICEELSQVGSAVGVSGEGRLETEVGRAGRL